MTSDSAREQPQETQKLTNLSSKESEKLTEAVETVMRYRDSVVRSPVTGRTETPLETLARVRAKAWDIRLKTPEPTSPATPKPAFTPGTGYSSASNTVRSPVTGQIETPQETLARVRAMAQEMKSKHEYKYASPSSTPTRTPTRTPKV